MLTIDPPATAGGTDSVQERFQTFEAKLRSNINPDLDDILHFYRRPDWQKTLRRFANIDEEESGVLQKR